MVTAAEGTTLFDWVENHAGRSPDSTAMVGPGIHLTYADLTRRSLEAASGLARLGVGPGDVVAAQLPNIPEFAILLLAAVLRGATLHTLHMPYRESELSSLLAHGGARVVVAPTTAGDRRPAAELVSLADSLPNLGTVVSVGGATEGAVPLGELTAGPPDPAHRVPPDGRRPFLLLHTSGTTSGPKGVVHTSRRFLGNAAGASAELGLTPSDRITSLAPFTHLYGLFTLHIALAAGATTALVPAFHPPTLVDTIGELSPTALFTAPAHLAPFVAAGSLPTELFDTTRFICLSGSAVAPALAREVDDLMARGSVIGLWGMTEIQVGTFGRPSDPLPTRIGTAGRPAPGIEVRVVNAEGNPVPAGVEGELQVRGPSVFGEYVHDPASTGAAFTGDGWFRTGDLARIDSESYVTLTGRTKEIINRGGIKYNPAEVENVLLEHPDIVACAVVPVPDPVLGERGCLCVQTTPGATIDLGEVTRILDERRIAKYKWPERIEVLPELPMTPTRKVRRGELVRRLER